MKTPQFALLFAFCLVTSLASAAQTASSDATFSAWVAGVEKRLTPASFSRDLKATAKVEAFRNEVVSVQLAVRSTEPLEPFEAVCSATARGADRSLPCEQIEIRYPGFILVDEIEGYVSDPLFEKPPERLPANSTQPIWLTIHVPKTAEPGDYQNVIKVRAGSHEAVFRIQTRVLDFTLPGMPEGSFYLNIWQDPAAVARYAHVPLWSEEHWKLLEAYARDLAAHGQKSITTSILHDPWRTQTGNVFPSMVEWRYPGTWRLGEEGKFQFDYTVFDRYVELMMKAGVRRTIHCYSLVDGPGHSPDCDIGYRDTETGLFRLRHTTVGDEWYRNAWAVFLPAFVRHLKDKGWLEKTYIGFDEKPQRIMNGVLALLKANAPELKITLAGGSSSQQSAEVGDLTIYYDDLAHPATVQRLLAKRRGVGPTTFYTACAPYSPNVFLYSPLWEARMLPWIAWRYDLAGYLRWAYDTWPDGLWKQPRFRWHSGDMFFVYPGEHGPISSTRWEMLRQGIQDYEALALLKKQLAELKKQPAKAGEATKLEKAMGGTVADGIERDDCENIPDLGAARLKIDRMLAEAMGKPMTEPNPYTSNVKIQSRFSPEGFTPDGNLDKEVWRKAEWVSFDHDMSGQKSYPQAATEVASFWTANYVYFAFRCKYTTLNIYEGEDPAKERWELWNRDVAEVFINPQPEHVNHYYEFEVAPNNQWIDLEIDKDKDPFNDAGWDSHFQHATRVDEKNKVWACEMRIPVPTMNAPHLNADSEWRINFYRADGPGGDSQRRFMCWSTIPEGRSFHVPTRFGIIRFVRQ
jgi:hypothetical protein